MVLSAQTGSWTLKILSTGNEKRKWYFLCLIEGLMIRGITSSYQIQPITCHFFKIQPPGCREQARKVGNKLSRKVTVKSRTLSRGFEIYANVRSMKGPWNQLGLVAPNVLNISLSEFNTRVFWHFKSAQEVNFVHISTCGYGIQRLSPKSPLNFQGASFGTIIIYWRLLTDRNPSKNPSTR